MDILDKIFTLFRNKITWITLILVILSVALLYFRTMPKDSKENIPNNNSAHIPVKQENYKLIGLNLNLVGDFKANIEEYKSNPEQFKVKISSEKEFTDINLFYTKIKYSPMANSTGFDPNSRQTLDLGKNDLNHTEIAPLGKLENTNLSFILTNSEALFGKYNYQVVESDPSTFGNITSYIKELDILHKDDVSKIFTYKTSVDFLIKALTDKDLKERTKLASEVILSLKKLDGKLIDNLEPSLVNLPNQLLGSPFGGLGLNYTKLNQEYSDKHDGIDIVPNDRYLEENSVYLQTGEIVFFATCAGQAKGYQDPGTLANVISIKCDDDFTVEYWHNKINFVGEEKVKFGQLLGIIGSTGNSGGEHLHYIIKEKGKTVNPVKYLGS